MIAWVRKFLVRMGFTHRTHPTRQETLVADHQITEIHVWEVFDTSASMSMIFVSEGHEIYGPKLHLMRWQLESILVNKTVQRITFSSRSVNWATERAQKYHKELQNV